MLQQSIGADPHISLLLLQSRAAAPTGAKSYPGACGAHTARAYSQVSVKIEAGVQKSERVESVQPLVFLVTFIVFNTDGFVRRRCASVILNNNYFHLLLKYAEFERAVWKRVC